MEKKKLEAKEKKYVKKTPNGSQKDQSEPQNTKKEAKNKNQKKRPLEDEEAAESKPAKKAKKEPERKNPKFLDDVCSY